MIFKKYLISSLVGFAFLTSLVGCGVGDDQDLGVEVVTQSSHGTQTHIDTDVSPSNNSANGNQDSSLYDNMADEFFEKKEIYDSFSDDFKGTIAENLGDSGSNDPEDVDFMTLIGNATPKSASFDSNCDVNSEFLCVDAPQSDGGDQVYTIQPGIDVIVRMDLNQLAVFGSDDPVAVVSVFNNDTAGAAEEKTILPHEVEAVGECDENSCVGRFTTGVGLGGSGQFTIVISAYRSVNNGEANELFSKMVVVYRTPEAVELDEDFLEARPVIDGTVQEELVENGDKVSAQDLEFKVRLSEETPYSPGIQVRFENYDKNGLLKGFAGAGYVGLEAVREGNSWVYTGRVRLHQGLNTIRIKTSNPEAEAALGLDAPAPHVLPDFEVHNSYGKPTVKILAPSSHLVKQGSSTSQKVDLEFCFTVIPEIGEGDPEDEEQDCVEEKPGVEVQVLVNGRSYDGSEASAPHYNSGTFTASLTPDFGLNLYQINTVRESANSDGETVQVVTPVYFGSFLFGVPQALIAGGELAELGEDQEDLLLFTPRGLNLDIDSQLIEGDIRAALLKFLNRDETSKLLLDIFKKEIPTAQVMCSETEEVTTSGGSVSIEFLEETFSLGKIELTNFKTGGDGIFHVGAVIHGMKGELDMIDLNSPEVYYGDQLISFIPLTLLIERLEISLAIGFRRNSKGNLELDLKRIGNQEVFKVIGSGPLGDFIQVNPERNPFAEGLKFLDEQSGLVKTLFRRTLEATFLCGIENGINDPILGKAATDIEKLINYESNLLRIPLEFELFGQDIQLDIAYHLLKGQVKFDSEGIHIRNVPLRFNPGEDMLKDIDGILSDAEDPQHAYYKNNTFASVSRFKPSNEPEAQQNLTNAFHKLGLVISEDGLNQALFAATMAGLLDLNVDANFYRKTLETVPNPELAPNGLKLAPGVDINRDGAADSTDDNTPVALQLRPDRRFPPMLTFLSEAEVQALAQQESAASSGGTTEGGEAGGESSEHPLGPFFVPGGKYFRIAVTNLEIAAFKQEKPKPLFGFNKNDTGYTQYCIMRKAWKDSSAMTEAGFCALSGDILSEDPTDLSKCNDSDLVTLPHRNGETLSHQPVTAENFENDPVPLYRVKLNLVLHGKLAGVSRHVPTKDKLTDPSAEAENFVHIQFAPNDKVSSALVVGMEVVENNTNVSDDAIGGIFEVIATAAFSTRCDKLNELRFAIPDSIKFDSSPDSLLSDLNLYSLNLGQESSELPQVFIDDSRLFLDVLVFADLTFKPDLSNFHF